MEVIIMDVIWMIEVTNMEDGESIMSVKIPDSFIRNLKNTSALSEYNDWVSYLRKELEKLYRDVLSGNIEIQNEDYKKEP